MIDPRFYETLGPISVRELSEGLHAEGDLDRLIGSVAPFERAGANDLCYYEGPAPKAPLTIAPGACLVRAEIAPLAVRAGAVIVTPAPRAEFGRLALRLFRPRIFSGAERVHPSAQIEEGALIGAGAVVGEGARIGRESRIGPNCVIGPGVAIGRRTRIGANCTIGFALIGDDVTILAGAVIGEAGFGVAADAGGLHDVPHLGRVVVQDRVTIGANTTIDRGVFDDTIIAEEAKIDNLCQIAHNVVVGRRVMMAAFAGVSGSSRIGDDVRMGGRVGVSDHRHVGEGAALAGGAAVLQDVPAGETWGGYPAKPVRAWMREVAWLKSKVKRDGG